MKHLLLVIGFFLTVNLAYSQKGFVIENDENFVESHTAFLKKIKRKLPKKSDLEIRIWIGGGIAYPGYVNLFTLFNKKGNWAAKAYEFKVTSKIEKVTELKVLGKAAEIWNTLEQNEVLNLPDMSLLSDQLFFINEDGYESKVRAEDGLTYTIELISENAKRKYEYYCPNAQLKRISTVDELEKIVNIINAIYRSIGRLDESC